MKVFYSFHYKNDNWRVNQVINMGVVEGNKLLDSNEWEEVKRKGDDNIKDWINKQMSTCDCLVVLNGSETYDRKWVKYEINHAKEIGIGLIGINIHNLKDKDGNRSSEGKNPFVLLGIDNIELFNPSQNNTYNDIANNIEKLVKKAIDNVK